MRILLVIVLMSYSFFVYAKGTVNSFATTKAKAMSVAAQGVGLIIDAREEFEIGKDRVKNSLWFPRSKMDSEEWKSFLAKADKNMILIFYCSNGQRAKDLRDSASLQGFKAFYFSLK